MTTGQQAIFDELAEYTGDARMINAPKLAAFWGRDISSVRDWLQLHHLSRYKMGNGYGYMIRDVAKAMDNSVEA